MTAHRPPILSLAGRQPLRAPDGDAVHDERHCPVQTTPYRQAQQHAASVIPQTVSRTGLELPAFIKDEFDAFLGSGARRMSQTAARWVDHVIPRGPW